MERCLGKKKERSAIRLVFWPDISKSGALNQSLLVMAILMGKVGIDYICLAKTEMMPWPLGEEEEEVGTTTQKIMSHHISYLET